eukprot:100905-Rhodomonas_salina.1
MNEVISLSPRPERLKHTKTHAREVKSWGLYFMSRAKCSPSAVTAEACDQFKEASLPGTATLRTRIL